MGGVNADEFEEYIVNSITVLFPNAWPLPGRWVIIKVDSGPGCRNTRMLARLWMMAFIIYPGVLNTTSVTQESDRLYGSFKDGLRDNLQALTTYWMAEGKSTSLKPWLCGLVIFDGINKETGLLVPRNAFESAFSRSRCKRAWELVGACALTEVCLNDPKVRRQLDDRDDSTNDLMRDLQRANDFAVHSLNGKAYDGDVFAAELERVRDREAHCRSRQRASQTDHDDG